MKQVYKRFMFFQTIVLLMLLFSTGCEQKPVIPAEATGVLESDTATLFELNGDEYLICSKHPLMSYVDEQAVWLNSYVCDGKTGFIGTSGFIIKSLVTVSDFTPSNGQEVTVTADFIIDDAKDASKIGSALSCEYAIGNNLYQPITGSFVISVTETTAVDIRCIVNDTDRVGAEFYIRPGE